MPEKQTQPRQAKAVITVQKIDDVWWLLDCSGQPFVSIGVNHVQGDCWLAPYNRQHSLDQFGSDLAGEGKNLNPDGSG